MGFFAKTVPDGIWAKVADDVYKEAAVLGEAFSLAIREESLREQFDSASEILRAFPALRYSLKGSANPSSSEAKRAKKQMDLGLKNYAESAKQALKLFQNVSQGGLGERLGAGGFASRAAAGRVAFQKTMLESIAEKAESSLNQAGNYIARFR
jgi:hypothetical protein